MLHTVFYDTRNALLSVRVWRARAEQQQVERPENNARTWRETGLDVAGLALTGLPPRSALISLIVAVLQLARARASCLSVQSSQSASGRDVVVVEYQFVRNTSSVLR